MQPSLTATSLGFIPGQNLSPSRFSDKEIQEAEAFVSQYLNDAFPTMDFVKGSALYDVVVRPTALIYLVCRLGWETLRITQSLKAVLENPDLSSDLVVDAILSNFQVRRKSGSLARGKVKMVFSKGATQSIPNTLVFRNSSGLEFKPVSSFRAILDVNDVLDLKLIKSGTNQYSVVVPVQAVAHGVQYQISDGVPMFVSFPSSAFIAASAFGNFSGGSDDESNEALINRLPEAMSVKNMSSRMSIASTIKDQFDMIRDVSVQGAFDPAMRRNSHTIFGFKTGGFADIYVKGSSGISVGEATLVASLAEISEGDRPKATYVVNLGRDVFPGHYYISSIRSTSDSIGSFLIKSQTKGVDTSGNFSEQMLIAGNLIPDPVEGVYSRYQTSTVVFEVEYDESLGTTVADQFESEISVVVSVGYITGIKEIQDMASNRESGIILADYLVKAAIPCFVRLPIITVEASSYDVADEVRLSIYNYINGLNIGDAAKIDEMVVRIRSVIGVSSVRLPISISGEIFCPSGEVVDIRSNGDLSIPYRPDLLVVPQNTAFFIELADVDVSIIVV